MDSQLISAQLELVPSLETKTHVDVCFDGVRWCERRLKPQT